MKIGAFHRNEDLAIISKPFLMFLGALESQKPGV
jgi:hypothetical protein